MRVDVTEVFFFVVVFLVVAPVVLGSAELKACVSPSKKKNNMLCAAVCGNSVATSWNKPSRQHVILFFCSALPLSEGLRSHRLGEKSCFYSLP